MKIVRSTAKIRAVPRMFPLSRLIVGGLALSVSLSLAACNIASPNLDAYRTTLPAKLTNQAYSNATLSIATPPSLPVTIGPNLAATNYVFFHEFRDRISILDGAVSLDNFKEYDFRLLIQIDVTNDSAGNPATTYQFTNDLSGHDHLNIVFYKIGTTASVNDLFTGDLSITQLPATAGSSAPPTWAISLTLMRTDPDATNNTIDYTLSNHLFTTPP